MHTFARKMCGSVYKIRSERIKPSALIKYPSDRSSVVNHGETTLDTMHDYLTDSVIK